MERWKGREMQRGRWGGKEVKRKKGEEEGRQIRIWVERKRRGRMVQKE